MANAGVVVDGIFGQDRDRIGAGYTWARNSQANRLTPWFNDPVTDPHGEVCCFVRAHAVCLSRSAVMAAGDAFGARESASRIVSPWLVSTSLVIVCRWASADRCPSPT